MIFGFGQKALAISEYAFCIGQGGNHQITRWSKTEGRDTNRKETEDKQSETVKYGKHFVSGI